MRITIVGLNYDPEPTGIAPYTSGLARGLVKRGHVVKVVAGFPHYPAWKVDPAYRGVFLSENIDGIPVSRVRQYTPKGRSHIRRVLMELTFGILAISRSWSKPDVVICVCPALLSSGLLRLKFLFSPQKPKFVFWTQDLYSRGVEETGSSRLAVRLALFLEARILKSGDGVAVIHSRFADYVSSVLGIPESKIKVIRNWTHLRPQKPEDPAAVRSRLGWGASDVIVLHAGNMGVKQGLENVVRTAQIASSRKSRIRFVLLGDGNQRQALEKLASEVGNLSFIRTLPDVEFQNVLGAADVLLVNEAPGSVEMAVPSKLTSYYATGLPIIAATSSGSTTASELRLSGGGLIVRPGDPSELLIAVEKLANDPVLSRRLGEAGHLFQSTSLQSQHAVHEFELWLKGVVADGRQSVFHEHA